MRNLLFLLLLAAPLLTAVPARAVDQTMFNAVAAAIPLDKPDLYDERAVLAGLLARPDVAAEFEAEGKVALNDPALKTLFVAKWRGKAAAYAVTQSNRPGVDYSKTYQNWKEVLGPEGYAYLRQRLLSMSKPNADKLIGYLGLLDQKLKENNYKIDNGFFSIANKIANGILDEYRKDLTQYLAAPDTRASQNGLTAAANQLAAGIQAKTAVASTPVVHAPITPVVPAETPATRPAPKPAPKPAPRQPVPPPAPTGNEPPPSSTTARDQLNHAHDADQAAGGVFDGGFSNGPAPVTAGGVTTEPSHLGGTPPSGLSPATPHTPVAGAVPSPGSALDDLDARVAQAGKSGTKPYAGKLGLYLGGGGALLGGLIGFLFGGPIGALIGAAIGGGAGYLVSKRF
jgi:hypothetical protein